MSKSTKIRIKTCENNITNRKQQKDNDKRLVMNMKNSTKIKDIEKNRKHE